MERASVSAGLGVMFYLPLDAPDPNPDEYLTNDLKPGCVGTQRPTSGDDGWAACNVAGCSAGSAKRDLSSRPLRSTTLPNPARDIDLSTGRLAKM